MEQAGETIKLHSMVGTFSHRALMTNPVRRRTLAPRSSSGLLFAEGGGSRILIGRRGRHQIPKPPARLASSVAAHRTCGRSWGSPAEFRPRRRSPKKRHPQGKGRGILPIPRRPQFSPCRQGPCRGERPSRRGASRVFRGLREALLARRAPRPPECDGAPPVVRNDCRPASPRRECREWHSIKGMPLAFSSNPDAIYPTGVQKYYKKIVSSSFFKALWCHLSDRCDALINARSGLARATAGRYSIPHHHRSVPVCKQMHVTHTAVQHLGASRYLSTGAQKVVMGPLSTNERTQSWFWGRRDRTGRIFLG